MRLLQADCDGLFETLRSLIIQFGHGVGNKGDWRDGTEVSMHSVDFALGAFDGAGPRTLGQGQVTLDGIGSCNRGTSMEIAASIR